MTDEKAIHDPSLGEDRGGRIHKAEEPRARGSFELHEFVESEGYVINIERGGTTVKLAKDGRSRLIPQPSDDPKDPLNWSWRVKHAMLFIVALTAFLPDYGSATGAITLLAQAAQWEMTEDHVNRSQAGNVFMLGAGGIIAVILANYFGRLPVTFHFIVIATGTAAWCAAATSFDSFMAARILNGFFSNVTQACGLMFIQDMFFFHERARKINIWSSFFIIAPNVGPLLAAFMMTTQTWPVPFWVYTALSAFCLVLISLFLRETYYDRRIPVAGQPSVGNRVESLLGIAQHRSRHLRNSLPAAAVRCVRVLLKPTILLANIYQMLTFAWVVGINTTLSIFVRPLYGFGVLQIGYFYFTPVVAVLLGEIVGHWLHDYFAKQYIRSHRGHFEPEVRLRAIAFAVPFMVVGLVLIGQCLAGTGWHYMATSVSWGLYVFGVMITTTAISSYCLDSYPEASGEVSAWLCNSRTLGGFIISYFQVTWATKQGTQKSFGIQAAVVFAAFLIVVGLMRWGKALRIWGGPLHFATS